MSQLNSNKITAPFVCGMNTPRIPANIKQIKLFMLNKMTHDTLRFDVYDKYFDSTKRHNNMYKSVGEVGLFEVYGSNDYCHLFFDIDHIKDEGEMLKAIDRLKEYEKVFGKCSLGCYTNVEQIAEKYHIQFNDDSDKFFSAHAIFYESKISKDMFKKWFKPDDELVDDETWIAILNGYERIMRHAISNKVWKDRIEFRAGSIINTNYKTIRYANATQLINIRGDEFEITDDMCERVGLTANDDDCNPWNKIDSIPREFDNENIEGYEFDVDGIFEALKQIKEFHHLSSDEPDLYRLFLGLNAMTNDEDERREMYDRAFSEFNFTATAISKYDIDASDKISKKGNMGCLINLLKLTNVDFHDVINVMYDESVEQPKLKRVKRDAIKSVSIEEVQEADNKLDLLLDAVKYVPRLRVFFSLLGSDSIQLVKPEELKLDLRACGVDKSSEREDIMNELYQNISTKVDTSFMSIYNGWYWKPIKSDKYESNIAKFKEVFLTNTFNNDVEVFEYYLKRTNYILRHPGALSGVMFWFVGLMGTGKNTFTDLIDDLFRFYSNSNLEMSKVCGRFNASTYGLCKGTFNEVLDTDNNKNLFQITEYLKKIVERETMDYERKGVDAFNGPNCLNADATSNNMKPVHLTVDNRRHIIVQASNVHADDKEYWSKYYNEVLNDKFKNDVFTYIHEEMMCDEFKSLPLPTTEAGDNIIRLCMSPIQKFIINKLPQFDVGMTKREISIVIKLEGDKGLYSDDRFMMEVMKYCVHEYDKNRKTDVYHICNAVVDKLLRFRNINEITDETKSIVDEKNEIIDKLKKEMNGHWYVLSSELPTKMKTELHDWLVSRGWKYHDVLFKTLTKRGYKLLITQ